MLWCLDRKWNQVHMDEQTKKPSPPQSDRAASGQRLAPHLGMMVKNFLYFAPRNKLFLLGIAVCAVVALTAFGQIELNAWNKPFYDALSLKDFWEFLYQLVVFGVIAGALLALNVAQAWLRELSKLKLREGLTRDLFDQWLVPRPALLTRMSSRPNACFVSAKIFSTSAAFATSPCTAIALPPLALMSATTRSAPSLLEA